MLCIIMIIKSHSLSQLQEKQTELSHKVKQLETEQDRLCKLRVQNKTKLENDLNSYYEQVRNSS